MAAAMDVFLQRNGSAGTELVENIYKERVIDGSFTLNNGIIVVQYKTGIF